MADFLSRKDRSALMSRIKSFANQTTELQMVKLLRNAGLRGWRRRAVLFGKPDFVWPVEKAALFIDGCFWHRCPKHGHMPSSRKNYWLPKLIRNQKRDKAVSKQLRKLGWRVLRIWEHDLKIKTEAQLVRRIKNVLRITAGH
jgi:DNA mismatch endonuclease, patch repair protein